MGDLIRGCLAGFAATAPMTAFMLMGQRRLPQRERYPLPPREIAIEAARRAGVKHKLGAKAKDTASVGAHFGYGALVGGIYGATANRPHMESGMLYGLAVWAASYLALLPAIGILKPAVELPWRRNLLMIISHLVWGASLGAILKPDEKRAAR